MIDEFFRRINKNYFESYKNYTTDEERMNSDFIQQLRECNEIGISVFKLTSTITATRIVAALAALCNSPGTMSFILFGDCFVSLNDNKKGNTPDEKVNTQHRDFKNLSDDEMLKVANCMTKNNIIRMNSKEICESVRESVNAGHMKRSDIAFPFD